MAKVSWLKFLLLAVKIAHDIVAALNDPQSPGHITADELKLIIANAVAGILDTRA